MKQSNLSSFVLQNLSKDSLNSSSESLEQDDYQYTKETDLVLEEQPKKRVVKQTDLER